MDTAEQINGYFFKGMWNLSPGELAFWILVDEAEKQLTGIDIVTFATIVGGFIFIHVPGKPITATRGRSLLSLGLRRLITYRLNCRWRSLTWKTLINGQWARTTSLGGLIGRWLPWLGVARTRYDVSVISYKTINHYNLMVRPEDRI
ncbi:hypothetical protein PUG81_24825 [Erwiniaceae bacterium L1_54_6]|nr:hypothetical protein [Erwiniaceae bacterium L1_54_6]